MSDCDRLKYDALTRQLERMRAMQYAYHRKFFTLLLVSSLGAGIALAVPTILSQVLACFGLVTTGVTAAFLLHFADFARTHARALEGRLNRLLEERVLIAADLEGEYFYPHGQPRPARFAVEWPSTFFSFYTLHFCGLWTLVILVAGFRLWNGTSPGLFAGLALLFALWTGANGIFLIQWFRGAALRRMEEQLRDAYGSGVAGNPNP